MAKRSKKSFYAVAKGFGKPKIYRTWAECQEQVSGCPGAIFKGFETQIEAEHFLEEQRRNPKNNNSLKTIEKKRVQVHDSNRNKVDSKYMIAEYEGFPSSPIQKPKTFKDDGLIRDQDGFISVFTDGACKDNGRINSRAGFGVYWGRNHPFNKTGEAERSTNNAGEIQAVTEALKTARQNGITKVIVKSDSQYTINCATLWLCNWKRNGWRKASGSPCKNLVELEALYRAMYEPTPLIVKFEKVKAHRGIYGNEMADRLAKQGISKRLY